MKRVLILGASGTVGSAVWRELSRDEDFELAGTYCSGPREASPSLVRFSVDAPGEIRPILEQVRPDIVISALRGNFAGQLAAHEILADHLAARNGTILYLSTANVFDGSCEKPHGETDPRNAESDYGRFKIQCEDLLRTRMGDRAAVLRLPFVWGRHSPRMQALEAGCEAGTLEVYTEFFSNHTSDLQIAQFIHWIIREEKTGVFHVGTTDVCGYSQFLAQLIAAMGRKQPEFVPQPVPGVMAVVSRRTDVPASLQWDSERLIRYLSSGA